MTHISGSHLQARNEAEVPIPLPEPLPYLLARAHGEGTCLRLQMFVSYIHEREYTISLFPALSSKGILAG